MVIGIKKYNPGFLSDDEIVASFCVRNAEFDSLLESLHASDGNSNVHSLVIGPRGSGKTHLLLRVAAEIRRDASLSEFYPIVFAEESYEVATVGEFWLECLDHLAEQAPECERANLRLTYNDLRTTGDDRDLAGRCLGTILDFADRHAKRMLLLVENLNMLKVVYYSGRTLQGLCCHFFENDGVDTAYEQLVPETDFDQRDRLLRQAGDIIFEEYGLLHCSGFPQTS